MIVVQIGKNIFEIGHVEGRGKKATVHEVFSGFIFETENKEANSLGIAVKTICEAIKDQKIPGKNITLVLNSDIVTKEFTHQKASKVNLDQLAKLEAEVIIPEDVSQYSVVCKNYSDQKNENGEYTSILYAMKNDQIIKIKKLFAKSGFRLSKIISSNSAYSSAIDRVMKNTAVKGKLQEGTFAAVDFSRCKTTISIYHGFVLTYQRSLNSIFYDLVALLAESKNEGPIEAHKHLKCNTDDTQLPPDFIKKAAILISSSIYDTLRNIRVNLGSERIEPSLILISGSLCAYPVFLENISPNVATEHIFSDGFNGNISGMINYKKSVAGINESLLMCGAVFNTPYSANMLEVMASQKKSVFINRTSLTIITLIMVVLMCVEPYLNYMAKNIAESDKEKIESYAEISDLNMLIDYLTSQTDKKQKAEEQFPIGKSKSYEKVKKAANLFDGKEEIKLKEVFYDGDTGIINVEFYASGVQSFNDLKNVIEKDPDFILNLSMEYELADTENYLCKLSFAGSDFTPLVIGQTEENADE